MALEVYTFVPESCMRCDAKKEDGANLVLSIISRIEGIPSILQDRNLQNRVFPIRITMCFHCIPYAIRHVKCDTCKGMMLDDWYTELDLEKTTFHCRCCLTDEIIGERFKYALGVDVPALDWWNAWKEPSDVFRKNLYSKIFKKATKRITSTISSTNKKRRLTTPDLHIEEIVNEDEME